MLKRTDREDRVVKKIFSIVVVMLSLFLLSGCGNNSIEFPEYKEEDKVAMTSEEVNTLLADVNMEEEMKHAMKMSMQIDLTQNSDLDFGFGSNIGKVEVTASLTSTSYMIISDLVEEAQIHSVNAFSMTQKATYNSSYFEDSTTKIKGDISAYLVDQYLYYDTDINSNQDFNLLGNGKFKINTSITQDKWDEFIVDPSGIADDYLDVGISPTNIMESIEAIESLMALDMISIYKEEQRHIVLIDITKQKILANIDSFIEMTNDTDGWTEEEFASAKIEFTNEMMAFKTMEMSLALVIEDNQLSNLGIKLDMSMTPSGSSIEVSATILFDMHVEMPAFPSDLDRYRLTEAPDNILF